MQEYEDGPWATGESDSHDDNCVGWAYDDREGWGYHKEAAGVWHFPDPDAQDEAKEAIRIEPLKQGFLVKRRCVAERAFTDRVDAAEWLLDWLGFNLDDIAYLDLPSYEHDADELYNILSDCVAGVDYDELGDTDCQDLLDVAEAAQAYVEAEGGVEVWVELCDAVKKWAGDRDRH